MVTQMVMFHTRQEAFLLKNIIIITFDKERIYVSYNFLFVLPREFPFVKVLKGAKMYITRDEKPAMTDADGKTTIPVTKHYLRYHEP
jgi:hypothetical protein